MVLSHRPRKGIEPGGFTVGPSSLRRHDGHGDAHGIAAFVLRGPRGSPSRTRPLNPATRRAAQLLSPQATPQVTCPSKINHFSCPSKSLSKSASKDGPRGLAHQHTHSRAGPAPPARTQPVQRRPRRKEVTPDASSYPPAEPTRAGLPAVPGGPRPRLQAGRGPGPPGGPHASDERLRAPPRSASAGYGCRHRGLHCPAVDPLPTLLAALATEGWTSHDDARATQAAAVTCVCGDRMHAASLRRGRQRKAWAVCGTCDHWVAL